jgi:hypothetical protein
VLYFFELGVINLFYDSAFEGFDCFNQGYYQQEPGDESYGHYSQCVDEVTQCQKDIFNEVKRTAKAVHDCIKNLEDDDKEILSQMGFFVVVFIFKLGLFVVLRKGAQKGFIGDL